MTAGVAAQEPLWGVQHRRRRWFGWCPTIRVTHGSGHYTPEMEARSSARLTNGLLTPNRVVRVVVSADGGRTWQPAGQTP